MDFIYKKLIQKYKDSILLEILLNIILVNEGIRPSFLLESSNYSNKIKNYIHDINIMLSTINTKNIKKLKTHDDNYTFTRTFIYLEDSFVDNNITKNPETVNDDFWIATYLGFHCIGHNYNDYLNDRIIINYLCKQGGNRDIQLITEVCEKNKYKQDIKKQCKLLLNKINKILNKLGFIVELHINISVGVNTKYKKLLKNDIKFLIQNIDEYINDFENCYISDVSILEQSILYKKLKNIETTSKNSNDIKKLGLLYHKACIMNYFDKYYTHSNTFDKIKDIAKNILEFDTEYWT